MTGDTQQGLIDQLDKLLESERQALLTGDLEKISVLLERKETLIDAFNTLDTEDNGDLDDLHRKVMRNQVLLNGALEGIRKVAARMAEIRRVRSALDTYDKTGRKQVIDGHAQPRVEKRA